MNTLFGAPMDTVAAVMLTAFVLVTAVVAALALRNPLLFRMGLRNLPRRRAQTTLIIVGLMLSTVIITCALGAGDTFSYSMRVAGVASLGTVDETVVANAGAASAIDANGSTISVAAPAVAYFPAAVTGQLVADLRGAPVDGVMPAIVESVAVQDRTSRQTKATVELAGLPSIYPSAFGPLAGIGGDTASLGALSSHEAYLSRRGAAALNAHVGDILIVHVGRTPATVLVRGILRDDGLAAGGLIAGDAQAHPAVLMRLDALQALSGRPGQITAVLVSNSGDAIAGARHSAEVANRLRAALAGPAQVATVAGVLRTQAGRAALHSLQADATIGDATKVHLRALDAAVRRAGSDGAVPSLLGEADVIAALQTIKAPAIAAPLNTALATLSPYRVATLKQDALDRADAGGDTAAAFFLVFGLFSIAAGVMLIFLIFVMLAAERRAEMGMARAIGTKRRHLIQQFLFEGYAYDLGAALVGLVIGILVSIVLVSLIAASFSGTNITIVRHFEPRSLAVAFCLGALVTFLTVAVSAWRVSRLNVVAAIRDLPDALGTTGSLGAAYRRSLSALVSLRHSKRRLIVLALAAAFLGLQSKGPSGVAIALVLYSLWSIRPLLLALIARGPLLLLDGALLMMAGLSSKEEFPFKLGVSVLLIGIAMLLRWVLARSALPDRTRNRLGYSLAGLLLVIFWSLPFDALQALGVPALHGDIEMFFLSGMMLVLGGVWTLMFNLDLLLGGLLRITGGLSRVAPIIKMAVTYPTQHRFRTGMTMAMFSLVMFTLMVVSVLVSTFNSVRLDRNRDLGGYDAWGTTSAGNPIRDIQARIAGDAALRGQVAAAGGMARIPAGLRQPGQADQSWRSWVANVLDAGYLASVQPTFLHTRARGYATDRQVWEAVATRPGYAVVDDWLVARKGDNSGGQAGFQVAGINYESAGFVPRRISLRDGRTGRIMDLTVIGVLDQAGTNVFNDAGFIRGVYIGQATLAAVHDAPAVPTTYFFRAAPGRPAHAMALALGAAFLANGLDMKEAQVEYAQSHSANDTFMGMLRGFLALGLVVGIAALGVIASRSVVERRQQIGVLRAIGFHRRMVRNTFLLESSLVAILGTLLGVGLGLTLARELVASFAKSDSTIHLTVPWLQVGAIALLAYGASLLTTYLPAWQASRVYPAEALRYE